MFDITKLYPYWRTYQEMNLMRTGPLFYLLKDIKDFTPGNIELFELLLFSCSATSLTFVLDQYLEVKQVDKIIRKIKRHHYKKIKHFQRKIGTDKARNFESDFVDAYNRVSYRVEHALQCARDYGEPLDDAADTALVFLFSELSIDYWPVAMDKDLRTKLIKAMIPVIHYTLEDCKELGIIKKGMKLKNGK